MVQHKMVQHTTDRTAEGTCPDCGAAVAGGRAGCQALWDELAARAYSDPLIAATHDLGFDAYCLQHADRYCRSVKSYAAHLTRLCCGLEHGGEPAVYAAINRWLSGAGPAIEKPAELPGPGTMNIVDVGAARNCEEHSRLVRTWAASVWEAWKSQQPTARRWINAATGRTARSS